MKNDPINQHLIAAIPNKINIVVQNSNSLKIAPTSNKVQKTSHTNILMKALSGLLVSPKVTHPGKEWSSCSSCACSEFVSSLIFYLNTIRRMGIRKPILSPRSANTNRIIRLCHGILHYNHPCLISQSNKLEQLAQQKRGHRVFQ